MATTTKRKTKKKSKSPPKAKKKKGKKVLRHVRTKKTATPRKARKKSQQTGAQQTALSDVVLKLLRKKRYVHPDDLRKVVYKAGYLNKKYAAGMVDLRDRGFVVVWVWEKCCYTINPTFHELYRWCLSNYRAIMTILRRTKPALAKGNRMAKTVRQQAFQESKKYFLRVYKHMRALNATLIKHPMVVVKRNP